MFEYMCAQCATISSTQISWKSHVYGLYISKVAIDMMSAIVPTRSVSMSSIPPNVDDWSKYRAAIPSNASKNDDTKKSVSALPVGVREGKRKKEREKRKAEPKLNGGCKKGVRWASRASQRDATATLWGGVHVDS